jgi:hypothetical protein
MYQRTAPKPCHRDCATASALVSVEIAEDLGGILGVGDPEPRRVGQHQEAVDSLGQTEA